MPKNSVVVEKYKKWLLLSSKQNANKMMRFFSSLSPSKVLAGVKALGLDVFANRLQPTLIKFKGEILSSNFDYEKCAADRMIYVLNISPGCKTSVCDIDITVAKKSRLESKGEISFFTPECEEEGKKCLFVFNFTFDMCGDGGVYIDSRGVHPTLQGQQVMKRTSVNIMYHLSLQFGEHVKVSSSVVHPATAVFYATREGERATFLARQAEDDIIDLSKPLGELLRHHAAKLKPPFKLTPKSTGIAKSAVNVFASTRPRRRMVAAAAPAPAPVLAVAAAAPTVAAVASPAVAVESVVMNDGAAVESQSVYALTH